MASRTNPAMFVAGVAALALLAGAGAETAGAQSSRPDEQWGEPVVVCRVADPVLNEASGLVASRRNPEIYYTHNDSGGRPHVYAIDRTGRIVATIRLKGAANVDWEDISLAPAAKAGRWDVCVADIGDNKARRKEIVIYRFPEPDLAKADGSAVDVSPSRLRCRYEDGPRNAEGFAVDPRSGVGYVFTKRWDGACRVYRLDKWRTAGVNKLRRVGSLKFMPPAAALARTVTAADISADGKRLVTRSYLTGWQWRLPESGDDRGFESIFTHTPSVLWLAAEPQGEALCFSLDQRAVLTISEGTPTTLYESRRGQ